MKKIINGKLYDTKTATRVGKWWSEYPVNDFHYYEETLYKKKTGEFFLYGEGNAASPYTKSVGQSCWSGAEMIIPFTEDEAKEWAERCLDADDYIAIFGEVEE